jgi:uncharacterized protein YlxW (UPF0749 family)
VTTQEHRRRIEKGIYPEPMVHHEEELLAEVERLESARDAATRHAAELETILRDTREERDRLAAENKALSEWVVEMREKARTRAGGSE